MNSEELFLIDKKISGNRDVVIICFSLIDRVDFHRVEALLFDAIPEDIGNYEGHQIHVDGTGGRLFAYGRNAEILFKLMQPTLRQFDFLQQARACLRFNKNDSTYSEIEFGLNEVA